MTTSDLKKLWQDQVATRTVSFRVLLIAIVVALLVGLGVGIFGKPARVETKTQIVHDTVTVDRIVEKVVTEKAASTDEGKTKTVYVDRVVQKDGTVETKTSIQYVDRIVEKVVEKAVATKVEVQAVHDIVTKTETKIVTVQPRWMLGVGAGAAVGFSPLSASPTYLVEASYRIAGPFSLGAWGTFEQASLKPSVGVMLQLQF